MHVSSGAISLEHMTPVRGEEGEIVGGGEDPEVAMVLGLENALGPKRLRDIFMKMCWEGKVGVHVIDDTPLVRIVE